MRRAVAGHIHSREGHRADPSVELELAPTLADRRPRARPLGGAGSDPSRRFRNARMIRSARCNAAWPRRAPNSFAQTTCRWVIPSKTARPRGVSSTSLARRCAGFCRYLTRPSLSRRSVVRCTLWRASPMPRAICDTLRGSLSSAPTTCQRALVWPAGRVRRSPAARRRPFRRNTSRMSSVRTRPAGVWRR
jgi:hypothetical protein